MDIITATLLILAIIPAVSYAWGMRGTTIGGENRLWWHDIPLRGMIYCTLCNMIYSQTPRAFCEYEEL